MVPVQNVIPGLIEPFPVLALIVTCLVGDQQPFAFLTNASHGNDAWGEPMPSVQRVQSKASNIRSNHVGHILRPVRRNRL